MTEEAKNEGRRGWLSKKSTSSVGGSTAHENEKHELQPKDLLKTKSGKEKRWFRKKSQAKEGSNGHGHQFFANSETTDLEPAEEKPVERTVQGFYRDDDGGPSPAILQTAVSAARDAVKEFTKDFVSQLTAKPDLYAAFEAQMRRELNTAPVATADKKFLVQAYTTLQLFSGFENASFGISNPGEKPWEVEQHMATCFEQFQAFKNKTETISKLLEKKAGDSFLSEFCTRKFKSLVPVDVESAMFGADCEHHSDLLDQKHPETAFYRSFLSAAVSVWLLQRLRFSFEQKVVTISPTRGDAFQRRFMLPAVPGTGDNDDEESDLGLEVLYTVFPGFRVGESIVKSLVYIVENPTEVETQTSPTAETVATEEQISSNVENVATEDQTVSNVATEEQTAFNVVTEEEIAPSVNYEAPESAAKNPSYFKSDSLPVTPSTRKEESSEVKKVKKSLSTKETSDTKGPKRGFFQRIRHKVFHKKTSKKAKNSSSPAVSTSVEGEPTVTISVAGEPTSIPTRTSVESKPAAHQSTPAATSSEPSAQHTPAVAAATTSMQGEISPVEEASSSEPSHQSTPVAAATTSVQGEIYPVEEALSSEPANQSAPAAAATTSVQCEISPLEEVPSSEPAHQSTPAPATTSVQGEISPLEEAPSSKPIQQSTPAVAAITSVQGEISLLGEAPSSESVHQSTPAAAATTSVQVSLKAPCSQCGAVRCEQDRDRHVAWLVANEPLYGVAKFSRRLCCVEYLHHGSFDSIPYQRDTVVQRLDNVNIGLNPRKLTTPTQYLAGC